MNILFAVALLAVTLGFGWFVLLLAVAIVAGALAYHYVIAKNPKVDQAVTTGSATVSTAASKTIAEVKTL